MAGEVFEWYGFRAADRSPAALASAQDQRCPFVPGPCTKTGGACSLKLTTQETVPVCPKRLYFDRHRFVREIASEIFDDLAPTLGADGLPQIVAGTEARALAAKLGNVQIGLFGRGWAKEIQLPAGVEGGARYSVDYTLVAVSGDGDLVGFAPIEVQTIDTVGNYQPSLAGLVLDRSIVTSPRVGLNWENVSKRILPQLITKGLILQGERLCASGLFFVTPELVFQRIMIRLGGQNRLREIPRQPGSITFIRYTHANEVTQQGAPVRLQRLQDVTISTSDMSLAFITPQNLAGAGAYEAVISKSL